MHPNFHTLSPSFAKNKFVLFAWSLRFKIVRFWHVSSFLHTNISTIPHHDWFPPFLAKNRVFSYSSLSAFSFHPEDESELLWLGDNPLCKDGPYLDHVSGLEVEVACCPEWQTRKNPHSSCRKAQIIIYTIYLRRDSDFLVLVHQKKEWCRLPFMTCLEHKHQHGSWSCPPQTAGGSFNFLNLYCCYLPLSRALLKLPRSPLNQLVRLWCVLASNHNRFAVLQSRLFPVPIETKGYHIISRKCTRLVPWYDMSTIWVCYQPTEKLDFLGMSHYHRLLHRRFRGWTT